MGSGCCALGYVPHDDFFYFDLRVREYSAFAMKETNRWRHIIICSSCMMVLALILYLYDNNVNLAAEKMTDVLWRHKFLLLSIFNLSMIVLTKTWKRTFLHVNFLNNLNKNLSKFKGFSNQNGQVVFDK